MNANLMTLLLQMGAGAGAGQPSASVSVAIDRVFERRPELRRHLSYPGSTEAAHTAVGELARELEAMNQAGETSVSSEIIAALKQINFEQQNSVISAGKVQINSPFNRDGYVPGLVVMTGTAEVHDAVHAAGNSRTIMTGYTRIA